MSCADTYPIQAQYVRYMHNTSSMRVLPSEATEEDGKTLFLEITKDHDGDCFLTLGRPTHELLAEEGDEQGGRAKRVRKSKPQPEEPAMSPKKKGGSPKKKGKKAK